MASIASARSGFSAASRVGAAAPPRQARRVRGWRWRWVATLLAGLIGLSALWGFSAAAATGPTPEVITAGSYEVAPVRILGIPVLIVASPQLRSDGKVVPARQRADLIENTLRMVYASQNVCRTAETMAEGLLEDWILGGPRSQRVCSSDLWSALGRPDALRVERLPQSDGSVVLQARLPGRPVPLPLLTVTAADAALRGQTPTQLSLEWQPLLQRRLRHARRTMQVDALGVRFWVTVAVELVLAGLLLITVRLWIWSPGHERWLQNRSTPASWSRLWPWPAVGLSRLLFALVLLELVAMVGLGLAALPGQIPLALEVLLLPSRILLQALVVWLAVWLGRVFLRFVLRQWGSNPLLPAIQRARREQRRRNLQQAGERLLNLLGALVLLVLALTSIPGLSASALGPWLAGGALLGALALVFQSLLRDFAAGLVTLLDDHYAIGDFVEIDGLSGDVEDIGVLATMVRSLDQRLIVIPNSRCDRLVNHTRLRSGVEVILPLSPAAPRLDEALALMREECAELAADPVWSAKLQSDPEVRGVKRVTPLAVELSVLLRTGTGQQWMVERELLGRLVRRCAREGVPLAQAPAAGVRAQG